VSSGCVSDGQRNFSHCVRAAHCVRRSRGGSRRTSSQTMRRLLGR
jgi:hypothetical protein